MACIKGVNRSASVAVAPEAPYMAAGTMAGAVDLSFSSSANIEIFKLDLQSDDRDLPVVGESTSSERFNRLSWSKPAAGSGSQDLSLGLIAGGLVDGTIDIWNPLTLIRSETGENASVERLTRHKGPVRGLEFNALAPNLLASGADDGEICIWDLANPTEPTHFPPLRGSGSAAQGEISFLSWNSKVQHILASSSYNGTTVIWDLKKQKPVISFADSVRRRCSVLQWNPDVATQLVVASDEDGSPSLRLWDMRNVIAPVKEFVGHTKGVIAMSWCPSDSSYLLTCAKDNRTICWDTNSAEIVCELPAGTNWNFDVHWYPKVPGVISASSFDGKIGIYNIEGCSRYGVGESNFGAGPLRAPKWYKRPAGASFGFGGKIVSFRPSSSGAGSSEVYVHSLVTEQSLVDRSSEFESAIQNGERASLRAICDKKAHESESADDRETWGLLRVMFEDDGTARTNLITHLGFTVPEETKEIVQDDLSAEVNALGIEDSTTEKAGLSAEKETTIFPSDNGEDFFNNLPSPKADTPHSASGEKFVVGDTVSITEQVQEEPEGLEESADPTFDESVQHALAVGDYKGAVAKCISVNKMADALVIAHAGGPTLWETTRDQYLKLSHSPYLKIVSAMVNNDLSSLVNTRPLKFWKETLAVLCSFSSVEAWEDLCNTLAARLIAVGNTLAATICYICAGNIDKTVDIWSRNLTTSHEGRSYVDLLQELMEKTIVLALATGQKRFSASLCKLVEKYAEILASQGLLTTAMEYLKLLGSDELPPELAILRDRIALSTEPVFKCGNWQRNYYRRKPLTEKASKFENPAPATIYPVPGNSTYPQPHLQPHGPGIPYDGGYPQPLPYTPAPYHPLPSQNPPQPPHMFVPAQTPQVPKDNFSPPPASTQPPVSFIPSTPPALSNVNQYQQPTLGDQLYPGTFQHVQTGPGLGAPHQSQVNSVPGNKMPHAVAPSHGGFMNVTNLGVVPGTLQPSSPPAPSRPSVAPPPPPTIQTVDTSKVPGHQKLVIATLGRLFNETTEALGGSRANPAKKREIEDNSKKIGALFAKLNSGDISKNAGDKLVQLCQALDNGDFTTALKIQVELTTSEWDECNFWLATLKRMIKTRQAVRLS
ncbi:protein transport protein SEC31 homolog B [Argentina anserina]|uniref:protein transport protein SEC31 homolog B n=1 Tax=Argentina anserina TaxID=57926 RepID=UPI0021765F97|nr:protein transport protein SEC31 homolog B [Potentilla anserina]